ncbi:MAG: hypothetical protein ACTSPB_13565 [Candidatus Thorarchaeota archaeon]
MKFVKFTAIQMQQVGKDKINVMEHEVYVNPELVCMVSKATIPGEITGPDGNPVGVPASAIHFAGGTPLLVKSSIFETFQELGI